jgi:serine/threonine protein kinase
MKAGETILGYKLVTNGNVSTGRCTWAFAERDRKPYFVKQFVAPKYPIDGAPGSLASKKESLQRCEAFEASQRRVLNAIRHKVASGGSIVAPIDFGRVGTTYYKVYDRIDVANFTPEEIARMKPEAKNLILRVVAHSVSILHKQGIVHGDMKPANILIKLTETGAYTSKLIDFDDSYFEGQPPEDAELVIGDPAYYSPELLDYVITNDLEKRRAITTKSDIFAMGIIFTEYWTGKLPGFNNKKHGSSAAAVLAGEELSFSGTSIPVHVIALLKRMVQRSYSVRPSADEVLFELKSATGAPVASKSAGHDSTSKSDSPSRLLGKRPDTVSTAGHFGGALHPETKTPPPGATPVKPISRLLGKSKT